MSAIQLFVALAPIAMVLLTFCVMAVFFKQRAAEISSRKIRLQAIDTPKRLYETLENTKAADNFNNLFQMPMLFYVLCLMVLVTKVESGIIAVGVWMFVACRALHSFIQCSSNRVRHRFYAYLAGVVVLLCLWIVFAIELIRKL